MRDILRNKKAVVWKTKRLEARFLKTLKNNEYAEGLRFCFFPDIINLERETTFDRFR